MTIENTIDKNKDQERQIELFGDILSDLSSTDEKKKMLWKQIYENAISDRNQANILFSDLMLPALGSPTTHQTNGPLMVKYLERMNKANDQILKLAELIQREEENDVLTADEIFKQMGND